MIGYAMGNLVEFGGFGEPNSCPDLVPVGTRGTVAGGNEDVGQLWVMRGNGCGLAMQVRHGCYIDQSQPLDRLHRVIELNALMGMEVAS